MMFAALATTNWFSETESCKPYFFSMFLSAWYIDCVNARSLCALGAISATFKLRRIRLRRCAGNRYGEYERRQGRRHE